MAFIQVMELRTNRFDDLTALEREWERATEGQRTLRREIVGRDRNDPDRYVILAFFDSYESAMENSNLPATNEISGKMGALVDGSISFSDLEIVEDRGSERG
jgi:hypothetical protein